MRKGFSGDSYALEHICDTEPDSMEMQEEFSVLYNQTCSLQFYIKIPHPLKGELSWFLANETEWMVHPKSEEQSFASVFWQIRRV